VGGVRTLLQPTRAQCLRLSERFFHCCCVSYAVFWLMVDAHKQHSVPVPTHSELYVCVSGCCSILKWLTQHAQQFLWRATLWT